MTALSNGEFSFAAGFVDGTASLLFWSSSPCKVRSWVQELANFLPRKYTAAKSGPRTYAVVSEIKSGWPLARATHALAINNKNRAIKRLKVTNWSWLVLDFE